MPTPAARRARAAEILVVQRDATLAAVLADILRDDGYAVLAVADATEGLEAAARVPPDLVLLQQPATARDAPAFLRALRALPACNDLPVLAVSTDPRPERLAAELEIQGVLGMPFELDDLLADVRRLARRPGV